MECGALSLMMAGIVLIATWSVDNLDTWEMVRILIICVGGCACVSFVVNSISVN